MLTETDIINLKQEAAKVVYDKMVQALIQYLPARQLKVENVITIAEMARHVAFDAYDGVWLSRPAP